MESNKKKISFKKIENGYIILINDIEVAKNTLRRDYVKSGKSKLRDKISNIWSISWSLDSLEKSLNLPVGSIDRNDRYNPFNTSNYEIRRWNERDVDSAINRILIKEVTQKDIKSRHPYPTLPQDKEGRPIFKKLTLDNLKALRDKAKRGMEYCNKNNLSLDYDEELRKYYIFNKEIKKRLEYINNSVNSLSLKSIVKEIFLEADEINKSYRTNHFSIKWNELDISKGTGKIFLGNEWFANAVCLHPDWDKKHGGEWYINKHTGAFRLKYGNDTAQYYKNIKDLMDSLENWYITTQEIKEDHGLGYGQNSTSDYGDIQFVRDPLNDPLLNNKLDESYRFQDHDWLANMAGFNKPTDVYCDTIHLGVITSTSNGYVIETLSSPSGTIIIKKTANNLFKTKQDAAERLHKLWKQERNK